MLQLLLLAIFREIINFLVCAVYGSAYMVGAALVIWWLVCWPLVLKIVGLNSAEAVGFFSKATCPMS
jgi:hypothetical protein